MRKNTRWAARLSLLMTSVVFLLGCGGGQRAEAPAHAAAIRSVSPLTFSQRPTPHEMTIHFTNLKARTRAQVTVVLRETPTAPGYGGDDAADQEPFDATDPHKTVRFYDLTPGTYRLEAHDADATPLTTDTQGNPFIITVTE